MILNDKLVLVTGANGFIGGRLVERLLEEEGARVRAMVRNAGGAKPLPVNIAGAVGSEFTNAQSKLVGDSANASPLQVVVGDVTDAEAVRRAVEGCDVVVHCAALQGKKATLDEYRRINVDGTLNLLRAARDANVSRFIHISTINVHGYPPPRDASADSPLVFTGDSYSISKAEAERAAWQFARNHQLPLVVIRPGCTYGPRSEAWTLQPLRRLRRGSPVLIGKGDGICNAVFIDNLVDLILCAMKKDAAVGQAFIGAEGRGVPWSEFYGAYARMIGVKHLRSAPRAIALTVATASEYAARLTRRAPFVSRASVEFYSHRVVYDIEKSREMLGYAPKVSFEEGMVATQKWLIAEGKLQSLKRKT